MGWTYKVLAVAGIFAVSLYLGCGGGGSSSISGTVSVSALEVAEKVSVVDASTSTASASISKSLLGAPISKAFPAGSDYEQDEVEVYISERSSDTFDLINEILCSTAQTQYDEMLNLGDYIAQVDLNQCSQSQDSASSEGESSSNQTSGSTAPDYEKWVVNSSRADNSSPHIVKYWIHEEGDGDYDPEKLIMVRSEITESKSSTNPYGIFKAFIIGYPATNGVADTSSVFFKGILKTEKDSTGKVLLEFAVIGAPSGGSFSEKAVLDRAADGSTGSGSAELNDSFGSFSKSLAFDIAYNDNYFLRKDRSSSAQNCFDRNSFDESAWRYGLYDSSGTRLNRNSGFPIKYTSGETDYFGWVGYWGIWMPNDVTISDGSSVSKLTYSASGGTETPYTAVIKGGKLMKHTKYSTTLDGIKNVPLDFYDMSSQTTFRVKWDGTKFVKFAQQSSSDWIWQNITESELTFNSLDYGELSFWSQAVGGQVRVPLTCTYDQSTQKSSCTAPTASSAVIYFKEDIVYPGDTVPASLRCYDNCPKFVSAGVIERHDYDFSPNAAGYNYTFNSANTDMVLKDSSLNALVRSVAGTGEYSWGFHSGPLFNPSADNLALLACDWDNTQTCGWKAWGVLSEYYTWETGTNSWSKFTGLIDSSGTVLRFEAPLQVAYTHTQTDANEMDYKYNGVTFFLDYSGFGELHGIPGACVDMDTGDAVTCGDGKDEIRWVPEFTITAGSSVTANGSTYYAKPLEIEQRMKDAPSSSCAALSTTSYTLPDLSEWEDPNIGSEPSVTGAPAVIGGVVQ